MKIYLYLFLLVLCANISSAQCVNGDCKNGAGKYNFGYAVYEGGFKNGEPSGTGVMDYGGGEKYMGDFVNGKENGAGLLYRKDGSYEAVQYEDGRLLKKEKIVIVGGNIIVEGCLSGDCVNTFSTLIFPSGNKYVGNFSNYQPDGKGTFFFASGNMVDGTFAAGVLTNGILTYNTGETFTGSFNSDGTPKTGKYLISKQGDAVTIVDNKIKDVRNIAEEKYQKDQADLAAHLKMYKVCPKCNGACGNMASNSWKSSRKTYSGTIVDEYAVTTHYGPPYFVKCFYCNGKGEIKR